MQVTRHILAITSMLLLLLNSGAAFAQCVAGVPCVSGDYTATDADSATLNNTKRGEAATCDGDFMNQIYARAFLESERETVMAQTYIRKPDSVLAYTCFDRFLNNVAQRAPPLFSESTEWSGTNIPLNIAFTGAGNPTSIPIQVNMGSGHIVPNLSSVVSTAMTAYLQNFNHDFLGGAATGLSASIAGSVSPGAYSCANMRLVWDIARCQNFPAAPDLFWTFDELAAADPRQLPAPGSCDVTAIITADLISTAKNEGPAYATATHDPIDLFIPILLPSTSNAECLPPVRTGLDVIIYTHTQGAPTAANPSGMTRTDALIPEMLCINPGCYYDRTAGECRKG